MTAPDLLRQLADCMEAKERLEDEVARLTRELAAAKAARHTDGQEWFSNKQAAAFIGLSEGWLNQDRRSKSKKIPSYKPTGKNVKYRREDLEKFLELKRSTTNRKG